MNQLFSDDEDTGNDHQLTINEHYAKAFEYRKEREELERLKAKYGSDYDPDGSGSDFSTDSESAESEDEHGEELTPAVDAAILRTLARIKNKDPEIYNSQTNIFGEESERIATRTTSTSNGHTKSKSKSKIVTIRQVNLEAMLNPSRSASPESDGPGPMTHVQEQEVLRQETIAAFHGAVEKVGDEDDFLIPREKTQDEREREEEEYRAFLEREVGDLKELVTVDVDDVSEKEMKEEKNEEEGDEKKTKKKKKKSKKGTEDVKKTKAEKDQEFLLNYILNRGWIDRSEGHVPTYNEVTTSTQERRKKKGKAKVEPQSDDDENPDKNEEDEAGLLSDASFESLASHFEASYNHRFEEPGAASIPSFPRNLPSLVRRQDTTRKDARERRKQRKDEELQKKKEEVRRLKALKMREVKRKLELIGRQGGLKKGFGAAEGEEDDDEFVDEALRELDLDGEWDPEKHDRQMAGLFDRGAEAFEDEGASVDGLDEDEVRYDADGKPVWDDDIDIGDIPISDDDDTNVVFPSIEQPSKKEKKKKKKKKKGGEDDDGGVDIDAMDADVAPRFDEDEEWDGTEEMRKRKFNEYMDEIYGLDFNDMIGDLPTRFKYVPVQPQTYALTPAEILMATDQELNEYMSVKKYAPYRHDKSNPQRWNKKTQEKLHDLKAKVGERAGTSFINSSRGRGEDGQEKVKKRKGKKERMKLKAVNEDAEGAANIEMEEGPPNGVELKAPEQNGKESKKRKRNSGEGLEDEEGRHASRKDNASVGDSESAAKKKRKRRHRKKEEGEAPAQQA